MSSVKCDILLKTQSVVDDIVVMLTEIYYKKCYNINCNIVWVQTYISIHTTVTNIYNMDSLANNIFFVNMIYVYSSAFKIHL